MRVPSVAEIRRKVTRSSQHPPPVSQLRQPYEQVFARDKPGGYPSLDSSGVLATTTIPLHSTTHKHAGTDEVAQHTPAVNAIPKAGSTTRLDQAWFIKPTIITGQNSLVGFDTPSGELTFRETGVDAITLIDFSDSPYTVLDPDGVIICDCSGGIVEVQLPLAADAVGRRFTVQKSSSDSNYVSLLAYPETIDGNYFSTISAQYASTTVTSNGINKWYTTADRLTVVTGDLSGSIESPVVHRASTTFALNSWLFGYLDPTQNDFAPGPVATLLLSSTGAFSDAIVTGISGGADGRILTIHNNGAYNITLPNESSSSVAANRFTLSANLVLAPGEACVLQYNADALRWYCIGASRATASPPSGAAGGVLSGTYPNPGFAADMATQAELDAEAAARAAAVSAEATTRGSADSTLAAADTAEAAARVAADALKANIASPTLTGDPKAPTPATSDNDTSIATTAMVQAAIDADVLVETNARVAADALKADLASPALTGNPTAPTASPGDNDTSIATTAFVTAADAVEAAARVAADALKANIASPTFTGDPKAPTPATSDNDTSIATTAMVQAAIDTDVAVEAAARAAAITAHEADTTSVHGIPNTMAITEANIAANTLTSASIATDAITGDELADNAVARDNIGDDAVGANELDESASYTVNWLTAAQMFNTALTTNRIPYTSAFGQQADDADLVFDGNGIIIGGEVISGQIGVRATRIVARCISGGNTAVDIESIAAGSGPGQAQFRSRISGSSRRRVQAADSCAGISGYGAAAVDDSTDATYPTSAGAQFRVMATESHTTTAKGMRWRVDVTKAGTASTYESASFNDDGVFQAEMLATRLATQGRSMAIPAAYGVYIPDHLTIAAGDTVEIGAGAVLEIG